MFIRVRLSPARVLPPGERAHDTERAATVSGVGIVEQAQRVRDVKVNGTLVNGAESGARQALSPYALTYELFAEAKTRKHEDL
jgi:hypothetical protein